MATNDENVVELPVARIDTRLLRPKDIELVTTEWVDNESGGRNEVDVVYRIRGNLPTGTIVAFFDLEQRIQAADESTDEGKREVANCCDEINGLVTDLVQERYPDAVVEFGVDECLGILAFMAQNTSVAHEVASALTAETTRPNRQERRARPPQKGSKATAARRGRSTSS